MAKYSVTNCYSCDMEFVSRSGEKSVCCPFCGTQGNGMDMLKYPVGDGAAPRLLEADELLVGCRFKEAEEAYRRALEIDPDNPYILLGIALSSYGVEFDEDGEPSSRSDDMAGDMEKCGSFARAMELLGECIRAGYYERLCAKIDGLDSKAALEKYKRSGYEFIGTRLKEYWGSSADIKIPDGTTHIEALALYLVEMPHSVHIPASVKEIAPMAFNSSVKQITVDGGNENYEVQGGCLIDKRSKKLVYCAGGKIADGVEIIGVRAFDGRKDIERVEIPEGVRIIERDAFDCCGVKGVAIPSTVTDIEDAAFANCTVLKEITVADGNADYFVESGCLISRKDGRLNFACVGCEIPEGVTELGAAAFNGAHKSLRFPASVKGGFDKGFCGCYELSSLTVSNDNPAFCSVDNCIISKEGGVLVRGCNGSVIPSDGSVKRIGSSAFSYLKEIKKITLPDGVEVIGEFAFDGCSALENLVLPSSLKSIGMYAFSFCRSLTKIVIPDVVEEIGVGAFEYCSALESVNIPASVREICDFAFSGCDKLARVEFAERTGWEVNEVEVDPQDLEGEKAVEFLRKNSVFTLRKED